MLRLLKFVFPWLALLGWASRTLAADPLMPLFAENDPLRNWRVTDWSDLAKKPPAEARWGWSDGVLSGSQPRGTWLVSPQEYADLYLEFDWRLPERGNSGLALRTPPAGDPAFDGLELQMVDPRYFPSDAPPQPSELTGALYRASAPREQVYRADQWNHYEVTLRGSQVLVILNGVTIQDLNLDEQTSRPLRHDGTQAPPLKDRPRRGHIGFQELSRGGGQVEIKNARLRSLE
jgi:hypothetical protein